jgi:general stress protein 26
MMITKQNSPERIHLAKLIEGIPIAMLTTLQADGALTSRPMAVLEMDVQGTLWFLTDLRSAKVEQLQQVNLGFVDGERGAYVSLSGRGEIDRDRDRIQRLWTPLARPWFPEGPESKDLALLKFLPDAADYWDGPSSTMVRAFGLIASAIAGKPIGLGEHGTHTGLSDAPAAAAQMR